MFFALPQLMSQLAILSFIQVLMIWYSWRIEYRADLAGAKFTSPQIMVSVLQLFMDAFGDRDSFSHPSPSKRIENVLNNNL